MLVRRAALALFLALGASSAASCGDATGEPIYADALSGPEDGSGGDAGIPGDRTNDHHCPDSAPRDDSRCELRDHTFCSYGGGSVECECSADSWHCRFACPAEAPDPRDARCENMEGMQCEYEKVSCFCTDRENWTCSAGRPSCPFEPPAEGSFCETDGELCPYPGFSCGCDHGTWLCR